VGKKMFEQVLLSSEHYELPDDDEIFPARMKDWYQPVGQRYSQPQYF
jgi:hypothetical protein